MKLEKLSKLNLSLVVLASLCSITGCVSRERVVEYEVTKSGKNWVENETIQEHRGPNRKYRVDKQFVYEKMKCINKKGQKMDVSTPEECIKLGGKVINETVIDEQTIERN